MGDEAPGRWQNAARPATIGDVAALAGVSVPTVSRVLTGSARVSPGKREAVEGAIASLNYRPSAAARALVSRRSQVVAILTGDTSRYGYAETIRGIEEAARSTGYTVMIAVVESAREDDVRQAVQATLSHSLAGIVVLKFDAAGVAALDALPADIPTVALSGVRDVARAQALLDETRAADELTTHLLSLGHRTVHHVRVPPSRREDGRTTGWRRALRRAGAEIPSPLDATWDPASGVVLGERLADTTGVTAVFCGNDEIAMGVMRGLSNAGRRVPDDVSVAGFDDHPLSSLWSPALTTARQNFAELGRRGMMLLTDEITGVVSRRLWSERPALIIRESTGVAPREAPQTQSS